MNFFSIGEYLANLATSKNAVSDLTGGARARICLSQSANRLVTSETALNGSSVAVLDPDHADLNFNQPWSAAAAQCGDG